MEKNILEKLLNQFIFLTTPDKVEKYVELIEKTAEAKIMMHSSSSDDCARHHNIEISSIFDPELQLINTKPVTKNK